MKIPLFHTPASKTHRSVFRVPEGSGITDQATDYALLEKPEESKDKMSFTRVHNKFDQPGLFGTKFFQGEQHGKPIERMTIVDEDSEPNLKLQVKELGGQTYLCTGDGTNSVSTAIPGGSDLAQQLEAINNQPIKTLTILTVGDEFSLSTNNSSSSQFQREQEEKNL